MTPVAASLLLALASPAAPALKPDRGLPKDLIDLLPEDTAAVLVIDVPRVAKTELGALVVKLLVAEDGADSPISVADVVRDAELVLIAQFLIDKGAGDFLVLLRLKAGSGIPKALLGRPEKGGKDSGPEQIGKRTVHNLEGPSVSFALADDRTVMLVGTTGDERQTKESREAAYGDRERPGPRPALRKVFAADPLGDRPIRVYGDHPTKLGYSAFLVLAAFGNALEGVLTKDAIVSYRGGIKVGEAAEVELRFTAKDTDTAKRFLEAYEGLAD
ncbi:MAG: hypothetical protein J2P46_18695, partial [Zavarzinella sp.]|nr:hypothetical protein [Zavarzinella sp.]